MRIVWLTSLSFLWAAAAGGQAAAPDAQECLLGQAGMPRVAAECMTLVVPLDPGDPGGRTLALAAARIPAQTGKPLPDPLVLVQGGPGGSSIDLYLSLGRAVAGLNRDRDIILLDQRGTGRSATGFTCVAAYDLDLQTAPRDLARDLAADCLQQTSEDPRFFTTSVAVRDLEALRAALGIAQWNLYGVSYGTRVVQHYQRRFPERVRSMVLDGVVEPAEALGRRIPHAAQVALDGIFERCARDGRCAAQFGDLGSKFAALLARAAEPASAATDAPPGTAPTRLDTATLLGFVRLMSYSATTAALLPFTLDAAFRGETEVLLRQARLVAGDVDRGINLPMHNSVVCSEDADRLLADPGPADTTGTDYLGSTLADAIAGLCAAWPRGPVDPDFFEPLRSDVPTLLLSGTLDPATPASSAEAVRRGLTRAWHIQVAEQGHGVLASGCMPGIVEAFIRGAGNEDPAADCIEDFEPTPFFLTVAGPAP